jgi:hypothetical protein
MILKSPPTEAISKHAASATGTVIPATMWWILTALIHLPYARHS